MKGTINYGFGKEYLSNWTLKEALREVLQNYIDYGEYDITTYTTENADTINVVISNYYTPDKLEFLRIGNSNKNGNSNAIGKHGEGLKMAFLIFLREGYEFNICTSELVISAKWKEDDMIGQTMNIDYMTNCSSRKTVGFDTVFSCPKELYNEFINDIITKDDIVYNTTWGSIVDKPRGNIYSGNLFVCHINNISYAYNIKPEYLKLDRDRSVPNDFDIEWYTSRINERYNNSTEDIKVDTPTLEGKDYQYTNSLPDKIVNQFTMKKVGTNKVYINTVDNTPIQNRCITEILDKHPKFKKDNTISRRQKLKYKVDAANKKSLRSLLTSFKSNYCHNGDMRDDITIIINRYDKDRKQWK